MLLWIYALFCFFVPCIIWQVQVIVRQKKKGGLPRQKEKFICHMILSFVFLFYLFLAAWYVAGMGTIWDLFGYGKIEGPVNLIPFSQSEGPLTYVLNIIMFLPLGFLLPLIWEDYQKLRKTTTMGFGFSLAIELCQLFCLRTTDIDDLLMNTLGSVIGYGIWRCFLRVFPKAGKQSMHLGSNEPVWYLILGMGGIFFLYNWRLFY